MTSNILSLPFRRTTDVSLARSITQYISTKYDQHPDMFTQDLQTIDQLRAAAVSAKDPHPSGIKKLQAYAAQLVWIGGKFPIDIGVDFVWYPALGYNTDRPVTQNNLRFELANILYNLAALYSQLAFTANRSTADGLKTACNYFSSAAGVLSYLKTSIIPEMRSTPPEDMDVMTMESLEYLMLAQAQECFWQKAVKDGMKDAVIAKLAVKVSDFYADAGESGTKSDAISSEWLHHMTAKHYHFAAAAQYRAACDCLEKRRYGEEVARMRDSLTCVNEALKEARYINKTVLGDLSGLKSRVEQDLSRAEKDNDVIYLQPVPPKSELKTLDRAAMVSPKVPVEVSDPVAQLGDQGPLGKPLFTRLVPYAVHVAASLYTDRRNRLVNTSIIDELEVLNAQINDVLASLNLPGSLQAIEKPLGLPPGLVSHAEEVRQQDGMNRIYRSAQETEKLRENAKNIYREGVEALETQQVEDDRARRKYGTDRWSRMEGQAANPKLYESVTQIDGYLKAASSGDGTVSDKIRENERNIRLLSGPNHDLEHFVPSTRRVNLPSNVEQAIARLRSSYNEVTRLESRRKRRVEALRSKMEQDDINPSLLKEAARLEREYPMQKIEPAQFEDFFEQRLHTYDEDRTMVSTEESEQASLLQKLSDSNAAFNTARKGDSSTREREKALQSLDTSYAKYKEIISNLDQARRFYNDLAKIVTRFRDDARAFAQSRRAEAQLMESDIAMGMASLSLQDNKNAAALHQQQQKQKKTGTPATPSAGQPSIQPTVAASNSTSNPNQPQQPPTTSVPGGPSREPIVAPQPQRPAAQVPVLSPTPVGGGWTPNMPIRFAPDGNTSLSTAGGEVNGQNANSVSSPSASTSASASGAGSAGSKAASGWDPSKGIRFG